MRGGTPRQQRTPRLHLPALAVFALALSSCSHSPLVLRTSAFATAATDTANNTEDAYELVEASFRDAQTASMIAHFDTSGFDPSQIQPFLPEADRKVRSDVINGLRTYAELLASVSGDQPSKDIDASAKTVATSLQSISSDNLVKAHFTAADANLAATAIDALGHELLERKRRSELPAVLRQMQQPIETICTLLAADIGDPAHSGLRNELHNNYLDLLRDQKNFIADNAAKLSPSEKRNELRVLPKLADAEADADHALASTEKTLLELARTHTALAATAAQKDAPALRLQLQQLDAQARQLTGFYSSLSSHH